MGILKTLQRKWWIPLPVFAILYGAVGFRILEGWPWEKCFYQSVITISTVGYDDGGMSEKTRLFDASLILIGVGVFFFVISYTMQDFIENANFFERRTRRRFKHMKDHFIICGAGRIGEEMAHRLKEKSVEYILIDQDPQVLNRLRTNEMPYISGDATDEQALMDAGVMNARGLACVLGSDADNVFATLTVRGLNPDLFIVSRANSSTATEKLVKAGANKALNPFTTTAIRLTHTLLKPTVTDFLEIASRADMLELAIEEIPIAETSPLSGCKLSESQLRQKENVIAAAIQKKNGKLIFNPGRHEIIEAGDVLIVLGSQDSLERLSKRVAV